MAEVDNIPAQARVMAIVAIATRFFIDYPLFNALKRNSPAGASPKAVHG
jgi:hypothetical protein